MAIIYTYPRLLNPDGTELIVVSETKNQNATRLLTVGDICDFCEGGAGSGCTDTFKYIQTTSPARATADAGCSDELIFQSSDASVTITNAGKVINFVAVGGGGGSCPTTYVIKPVCCTDGPECDIQTNIEHWLYTCDETLGAMADGYIYDLKFNGTSIEHPCEPSTCWWIEELTMSATAAADCDECCETQDNYELSPCDVQYPLRWTNDANSSGPAFSVISDYGGKTILADAGDGDVCYNVYLGNGPITTTTITTPLLGFDNCDCCEMPNWEYDSCDGGSTIIIDPTDYPGAGLSGGQPDPCITVKENDSQDPTICYQFSKCTDSSKTGVYFEVYPSAYSPCCETPACASNFKYVPCPGNPIGYNDVIVDNVDPGYDSGITVQVNTGGLDVACYTLDYPTYDALTGVAPVIIDVFDNYPSEGCDCCFTTVRNYESCDDGAVIYIDVVAEGFSKNNPPQCINVEYSASTVCYNIVGCQVGALQPGIINITDISPNCCEDESCPSGTLRYVKCPSAICGDAPGSMSNELYFDDNGSMPNNIIVTYDPGMGTTTNWCYYLDDDGANLSTDPDYTYVPRIPDGDGEDGCCPCEVYEYQDCLAPGTPLYTNNSGIMNTGLGSWRIVGSDHCFETVGVVPLPQVDIVINEIDIEYNYEDCTCCASGVYPNVHEYSLCWSDPPVAGAPPVQYVDITGYLPVGSHPPVVTIDVGLGFDVCYEWARIKCDPPDTAYIQAWDDCTLCWDGNPPPQMIELHDCLGVEPPQYVLSPDFTPDITGQVAGDVIRVSSGPLATIQECWEIIDMNSAQPATQTGNNDWTGPFVDPGGLENDCGCCIQRLYRYDVCVGAPGPYCDGSITTTLTIDLGINGANIYPVVPSIILAEEDATGYECCYTLNGPLPCDVPTGTWKMTVTDCDPAIDVNCLNT